MARQQDRFLTNAPAQWKLASEPDEFVKRLDEWTVLAEDPFPSVDSHPYTPAHKIREYLTDNQLRKLLLYCRRPPDKDLDAIRNNYLIVFAILIFIGKGAYIGHFTRYDDFVDTRLPFGYHDDWPSDTDSVRRQFVDAQWRFCAKTLERHRLNDTQIPPQMIIPFKILETLKEDADLRVCKVEIPTHYNFLNRVSEPFPTSLAANVTNPLFSRIISTTQSQIPSFSSRAAVNKPSSTTMKSGPTQRCYRVTRQTSRTTSRSFTDHGDKDPYPTFFWNTSGVVHFETSSKRMNRQ
jgi:hypothetical protein